MGRAAEAVAGAPRMNRALSLSLVALVVGGMTAWPGERRVVDPSTREMAGLLAELAAKGVLVDPALR